MCGLLNASDYRGIALAEGSAVLLGGHQHTWRQQSHFEGAVMTPQERELMINIRCQQQLGKGMFLNDAEFKAWAAKTYGISEVRLTELQRELLA